MLVDGEAVSLVEFEGEAGEFNDALCDEAAGVFVWYGVVMVRC